MLFPLYVLTAQTPDFQWGILIYASFQLHSLDDEMNGISVHVN